MSAGIWRDVYIRYLPPTRWRSVYWATTVVDPIRRSAVMFIDWDFVTDVSAIDGWQVRLRLEHDGTTVMRACIQYFTPTGGQVSICRMCNSGTLVATASPPFMKPLPSC